MRIHPYAHNNQSWVNTLYRKMAPNTARIVAGMIIPDNPRFDSGHMKTGRIMISAIKKNMAGQVVWMVNAGTKLIAMKTPPRMTNKAPTNSEVRFIRNSSLSLGLN
jgi:hypothetical protein